MGIYQQTSNLYDALLKEKERNAALPAGDEERLSHGQLVALNDALDSLAHLLDMRIDCADEHCQPVHSYNPADPYRLRIRLFRCCEATPCYSCS